MRILSVNRFDRWETFEEELPGSLFTELDHPGSEFQISFDLNFPESDLALEWKNIEVTP